jgi:hypothetical protein
MKKSLGLSLVAVAFACLTARAEEPDFGDASSSTLTTKAWNALNAKDYKLAVTFAKKCVDLYEKEAVKMQKDLKAPVPADDKEAVAKKWALNDVGTCFYIMAQALEKQDKGKEALAAYKEIVEKVSYAQCWDPKGWYWKPADAAKTRIKALEFDTMK